MSLSRSCFRVLQTPQAQFDPEILTERRRGELLLPLGSYCVKTLTEEIDEMFCVVFCSRNGAALESGAGCSGTAKAGGGGDEFHHLKGDLFIAAQRWSGGNGCGRSVAHGSSPRLN